MLADSRGIALLEVLVSGVVMAVAVIGLALMFGLGQSLAVAQGDERLALYLAEQKLEQLRALGFAAVAVGSQTETLTGGQSNVQTFLRTTCIVYVDDTTLGEPADTACVAGVATATKRIRVTVTPAIEQAGPVTLEAVLSSPL
ncbi:MAG TPA: hypothetical protein VGT40_03525 [Methylomirabilota bacterium]|jgi:Tfp pilus assembly protein PilV|nr:hypothetical protein [Methylomirabilota bacterium]